MNRSLPPLLSMILAAAGCTTAPESSRGGAVIFAGESAPNAAHQESAAGGARDRDADAAATEPPAELGPLDLDTALRRADLSRPDLRAARAALAAAGGRVDQAGLLPNPEARLAIESARLEGATTGDAELLAGVEQTLPLGGRLGAERRAAEAERSRLDQRLAAVERSALREVRLAFFRALHARELVRAVERRRDAAADAARIADALVAAGDAAADDAARAHLELGEAELDLDTARSASRRADAALAAALGEPALSFGALSGDLEEALELPSLEALLARIDAHPELLESEAAVSEREARLDVARAERIPDLGLYAGYRRIGDEDDDAVDVGVAFSIPLFDLKRGAVAAAEAELAGARADAGGERARLEAGARALHERLRAALHRVTVYGDTLEPRAEALLAAMEARHREGDVSLAEVLPVRRRRWGIREEYLAALHEAAALGAELAHLTGE